MSTTRRQFVQSALLLPSALAGTGLLVKASSASASVCNHQAYVNAGDTFTPFWELGASPEFRCVAVLGREKAPRGGCSCVLIASNYILTSAHAFVSNDTGSIDEGERFVTFVDAEGKTQVYKTKALYVPQGYFDLVKTPQAWKGPMDVAIAELDRPVTASGVVPALIYDKEAKEPLQRIVTGVGYGIRGTTQLGMSAQRFGIGTDDATPRPFGFQLFPERFEQPEKYGALIPVTTYQEDRKIPLSGIVTGGDSGGGYFVRTPAGWRLLATTCYSQAGNDGRFANVTNYDGCEMGILTLSRFHPAIRRGLQGDWSSFRALRLDTLPVPLLYDNRREIGVGELRLDGIIETMQTNTWTMKVRIVSEGSGKQTVLPEPRLKTVDVDSNIVISHEPKQGKRISLIGMDGGKGKPITARILEVR